MTVLLGLGVLVAPALYALLLIWLRGGIRLVESAGPAAQLASPVPVGSEAVPLLSVLVAARDEVTALPHLLQSLRQQTLPAPFFEVLLVDDHSTDGTAALVAAAAREVPFCLRVLTLPPGATGKKAALAAAEAQARAPWAVCTDADCRPGPDWLATYAAQLRPAEAAQLHFLSGPV